MAAGYWRKEYLTKELLFIFHCRNKGTINSYIC
jgi:hypothetical protein